MSSSTVRDVNQPELIIDGSPIPWPGSYLVILCHSFVSFSFMFHFYFFTIWLHHFSLSCELTLMLLQLLLRLLLLILIPATLQGIGRFLHSLLYLQTPFLRQHSSLIGCSQQKFSGNR